MMLKVALATTAVVAAVAAGAAVVVFVLGGGLFANEMACSQGEAPADNTDGGSACFAEGSELPPGFTWDPRGNHKIN